MHILEFLHQKLHRAGHETRDLQVIVENPSKEKMWKEEKKKVENQISLFCKLWKTLEKRKRLVKKSSALTLFHFLTQIVYKSSGKCTDFISFQNHPCFTHTHTHTHTPTPRKLNVQNLLLSYVTSQPRNKK